MGYKQHLNSDGSFKDKEKYLKIKSEENKRRRERQTKYIQSKKSECLFCGGNEKLEFHHFNPLEKNRERSIYQMAHLSVKKIDEEISKCWCLCYSCHKKLHQRLCDPLPMCYDT